MKRDKLVIDSNSNNKINMVISLSKITDEDIQEGKKNLQKGNDFDEAVKKREEEKRKRAEELEKVKKAMEEAANK